MSSLHKTSIQTYRPLNQKLETLEQQLDEVSFLLAQSVLRKEKLLARALMQLQSISAAVHSKSATISIPNDPEVEPMTPSTKDMGVDPISLDTTTKGMADTLPIYHTADYGMLEGPLPSTLPIMGERVASTPNFYSATNCGLRSLYAKAVMEAETALTPNLPKTIYRQFQWIRFATLTSLEQTLHYQFRSCCRIC